VDLATLAFFPSLAFIRLPPRGGRGIFFLGAGDKIRPRPELFALPLADFLGLFTQPLADFLPLGCRVVDSFL